MPLAILVSQPEIELVPPAVEAVSLNHWTTRELPTSWFSKPYLFTYLCEEKYYKMAHNLEKAICPFKIIVT